MGIESGAIDPGALGDILDGDGLEAFFIQGLHEGLFEQLARAPHAGIKFFLGEGGQHFCSNVA
jgi:hypothetical protein